MPRYRRGSGSVYRRGKHLWLSYYRDGRRIREPVRTKDPAEARRLLNQKLGRIAEDTFSDPRPSASPSNSLRRQASPPDNDFGHSRFRYPKTEAGREQR